jgi:exonuclease III
MATRTWKVLSWNVRAINSDKKWDAVRDRFVESSCDIICLQETKKDSFDKQFVNKICPSVFYAFDYISAIGASGGSIIIWKSCFFSTTRIFQNDYCLSVESSMFNNDILGLFQTFMSPALMLAKENS